MADITADLVKRLREATNVGMMECKTALMETNGDMNAAVTLLRERGVAVAAKRAEREANQGLICTAMSGDGALRSLVEVNSETDFVARNEAFRSFAQVVAERALICDDVAAAMHGELMDKIAAIGENLRIRRGVRYRLQGLGRVQSYIHPGAKVGVLVELGCEKPGTASSPAFEETIKDLTLQIAAASPRFLTSAEVPPGEIATERAIYAKQVDGKPAAIVDKIVDGKMSKFFSDVCLVDQGFVKEPKQTIGAYLAEKGKALNDKLTIRRFVRFQLGA